MPAKQKIKSQKQKQQNVAALESSLDTLCKQDAVKTQEVDETIKPIMPSSEQAMNTSSGVVDQFAGLFMGKAHAAPPSNAGSTEPGHIFHAPKLLDEVVNICKTEGMTLANW